MANHSDPIKDYDNFIKNEELCFNTLLFYNLIMLNETLIKPDIHLDAKQKIIEQMDTNVDQILTELMDNGTANAATMYRILEDYDGIDPSKYVENASEDINWDLIHLYNKDAVIKRANKIIDSMKLKEENSYADE